MSLRERGREGERGESYEVEGKNTKGLDPGGKELYTCIARQTYTFIHVCFSVLCTCICT